MNLRLVVRRMGSSEYPLAAALQYPALFYEDVDFSLVDRVRIYTHVLQSRVPTLFHSRLSFFFLYKQLN